MPSLDDLGSRQIVEATPASDDLMFFYDISESGNAALKKARVSSVGLQLDENGNLEVDGLIVADSSALALADGVIGWNAALNAFVEHDGVTIGGNQIIPNDPLHARGSRVILGSEVTSDAQFELHRFPIESADAVVGQRFRLSGTYYFAANGTRPTSVYFGIIPEDSEAAGVGIVYGADHSGSTLKIVKAYVYWEFQLDDGGGGTFILGPYASNSAETRLTGTTTSEALVTEAYTASSEAGTTGAAQDLVLQIQTSATASAAPCFVAWDLKLEATN